MVLLLVLLRLLLLLQLLLLLRMLLLVRVLHILLLLSLPRLILQLRIYCLDTRAATDTMRFQNFQNCLQEVFFGARNASIGYVEAGYVVAATVAVVRGSPFRITDAPRKRILERREKVEYGQSHQHAIVRYHAPRC